MLCGLFCRCLNVICIGATHSLDLDHLHVIICWIFRYHSEINKYFRLIFAHFRLLSLWLMLMIIRQSANIPSEHPMALNIQIARRTSAVTILIGYSVSAKLDYSRYYLSVLVDYADGVCSETRAVASGPSRVSGKIILLWFILNANTSPYYNLF